MSQVSQAKLKEDKLIYSISIDEKEKQQTKNTKNIILFSELKMNKRSSIASRGRFGSSKYILIPKRLRKNSNFLEKSSNIGCKQIETKESIFIVFKMDKNLEVRVN